MDNSPVKGGTEAASRPHEFTHEQKVQFMLRLLRQKGKTIEREARQRISKGAELHVKGQVFSIAVLSEAVSRWQAELGSQGKTDARAEARGSSNLPQKRKPDGPTKDEAAAKRACNDSRRRREDVADSVPTPCRSPGPKGHSSIPCLSKLPKVSLRERLERRVGSHEELKNPEGVQAPPSQTQSYASSTSPATARQLPTDPQEKQHAAMSIKELKTALSAEGIDCTGCVEKGDLLALWQRFEQLQSRSLEELQEACQAAGGGRPFSASACARFLLTVNSTKAVPGADSRAVPEACRRPAPPTAPPPGGGGSSSSTLPTAFVADSAVASEARRAATRILALRQPSFRSASEWAFAVLELRPGTTDVAAVQRSFRQLMRSLHPDKAGDAADVSQAVDCVRRARGLCERALSKEQVPSPPRSVGVSMLSQRPGERSFELTWQPPTQSEHATVRRYVVAVFDPGYGQPLTVASLEPDYNEELQRYVSLEDLTRYVLSEKDLQKMPKVWTQASLTVHIAAANEAGQSTWAIVQVPLVPGSAARRCPVQVQQNLQKLYSSSSTPAQARQRPPTTVRAKPEAWGAPDVSSQAMKAFLSELHRRSSTPSLGPWLKSQPKQTLAAFLRTVGLSTAGSKDDLASRVELFA